MEKEKYSRIWELIKKASPQEKKEIINNLSEEDLKNLRYFANPYRKPLYKSKKKNIVYSIINMTEEYTKNFMMTSLVGFIYKMATEYDHVSNSDLDGKYVSEENNKLGETISEGLKEASIKKFENHYAEIYNKTQLPLDKARWMRAQITVFKKNNSSAAEEITQKENIVKKYCLEHGINYEEAFPQEVQLNEEDAEKVKQEAKKTLGIKKTLQEKNAEIQDYILDFLDYYLKFDPNNHIRCGYYPNYDKVIKNSFESNPENFEIIKTPNGNEMLITKDFERYLIPPLDTFYSLNNYIAINYEPLRQATDDIYFPSYLENAFIAREVFDTREEYEKWQKKYGNELDVSCYETVFNEWTFLDSWKENREKIVYDDEKGKLINEIIERKKQEEKMGKEILGKKKQKNKTKTVSGGLPFTSEAASLGAEKLEKLAATQKRSEKDLEVNVISTKLLRRKRGVKTATSNFNINTPSEN